MILVCLDLEGVLIPEIWIGVAEKTGIEELRLTTREISDYDELMSHRLGIMKEHGLGIGDITSVIQSLNPLEGAIDFVEEIRSQHQLVILSDTFYQFARPMMEQLGWPTLFCHDLDIADSGEITGYRLRQADPKAKAVKAFQSLKMKVVAAGDSYNDTSMLKEADRGILFRPPANVIEEFPQFPVHTEYRDFADLIGQYAEELDAR